MKKKSLSKESLKLAKATNQTRKPRRSKSPLVSKNGSKNHFDSHVLGIRRKPNGSVTKRRRRRFHPVIRAEIANSVTHGIGAGLSIAAMTVLVTYSLQQNDTLKTISFLIYGLSLIVLYLASTLYHSINHIKTKHVFRIMDHSAIFIAIAGTYTPFALVKIQGSLGWTVFSLVWGLAALGIVFKVFFVKRFDFASTIVYILMGWLAVFFYDAILENLSRECIYWLVAGGLSYTLGTIFYGMRKLPYHHAIWHLFVLGGSVCHYFAVYLHILPAS